MDGASGEQIRLEHPGYIGIALAVTGRTLNPAVQIVNAKNNYFADCLPVPARRARRLSGRSAEKFLSI